MHPENPISKEINCRRMTEKDLPQVMALGNRIEGFQVGEDSGFWPEPILRRWLTSSDDPLLVAESEGNIVGFILGAIHHPTKKTTLENILITKEYRGRGVGRMLLNSFMRQMERQGVEYICALSKTTNTPAINFFLKQGFTRGYDFAWIYQSLREPMLEIDQEAKDNGNDVEDDQGGLFEYKDYYHIYPGYVLAGGGESRPLGWGDDDPLWISKIEVDWSLGGQEVHDIRNREFTLIDGCFSNIPSRIINYKIATGGRLPLRVLDVGGGTDSVAVSELAKRYEGKIHVTNVDLAIEKSIKDAPNCQSIVGDVCDLQLPDESIDLVYTWQCLHSMDHTQQERALRQIIRVLRPGGVACIDEERYCHLREDDPEISKLVDGLGIKLSLIKGTQGKNRSFPDGRVSYTTNFLFLMKYPIDPKVLSLSSNQR